MKTVEDARLNDVVAREESTDVGALAELQAAEALSLWDLASLLWARRILIVVVALVAAALALAPTLLKKPSFTAQGSFVLSGTDQSRSALAGLAGQFGVAVPTAGPTSSPQLYADLVKSRAILGPVVDTSFATTSGARPTPLPELIGVTLDDPAARHDEAIRVLGRRVIEVRVNKITGMITVLTTTRWPLVSRDLAQRILTSMNDFTVRLRRDQAAAERSFSDERLAVTRDSLRTAENRLEGFLRANRQWQNSPDLTFEHDRLQRLVMLQEQLFQVAAQTAEEARSREARNTAVLSILDAPTIPTSRDALGRFRALVIGGFIGALLAMLWTLFSFELSRHRTKSERRRAAEERLAAMPAGRSARLTARGASDAQR